MAPVTWWLNKHLIGVGHGELMIDMPLKFLRKHPIDEVTIVTGANHAAQIVEYVGDGERYGFKRVEYAFQSSPKGIADILNRVSRTSDGVLLILGDNYFSTMQTSILEIAASPGHARAWEYDLGDFEEAKRFGQVMKTVDGTPCEIVEKPKVPQHSRILTGLYYFPASVFDKVASLSPSQRGELEITGLLEMYLNLGLLEVHKVLGDWEDLGEDQSWRKFVASR